MDAILSNPISIFIIAAAVIAVVVAFIFRQKIRLSFRGPNKTGMDLEASNSSAAESSHNNLTDVRSRKGGLKAKYETNRTTNIQRLDTKEDIEITVTQPPETAPSGKKPKKT